MQEKNNKLLKKILKEVFTMYLISSIIIIILKTYFSYQNGEDLVETVMLNFRTYFLGSITTEEKIFSMNMDSIGLFAIHLSIFFALLINYVIIGIKFNKIKKIAISFLKIILGAFLTVFLKERFVWCLPMAVLLSGVLLLLEALIEKKIDSNNLQIIEFKFRKIVALIVQIGFIIFSVISIIITLVPYCFEEI